MAGYSWTFDAATGVFKQHALSKKLYEKALEESVFMPYVRPVTGYGKNKGENVTLIRISDITEPSSGTLSESTRIPEDNFAMSTIAITVSEYGRAVPYTSLSEDLSEFDVSNVIQRRLMAQQKLVLDSAVATAFKTAKVTLVSTGVASGTFAKSGSFGSTATNNLNVYFVEQIADYLYDTLRAPAWSGEDYMGILRTSEYRGIMRDPAWEQWKVYTTPDAKATGEIGRLERIRFVRTNHDNALGATPSNSAVSQAVFFGEDAIAMAEVQTPELRAGLPADYGRSKGVAWYGILGFGIIWDTGNPGEARIVYWGGN